MSEWEPYHGHSCFRHVTWVNPSLIRRCLKVRANCSSSSKSLCSSPMWVPWVIWVRLGVSEDVMTPADAEEAMMLLPLPPPTPLLTIEPPPLPLLLLLPLLLPPITSLLFSLCKVRKERISQYMHNNESIINTSIERREKKLSPTKTMVRP